MTGIVYNIQRYSLDDGPGIRTTVFLKGCPLHCAWCSNPESQSLHPELSHRESLCVHCGNCVESCPNNALDIIDGELYIDRLKCMSCGTCVDTCIHQALSIMGQEMSADTVMQTVRRDKVFYETSGGGLTLSGGEILAQPQFAAEILRQAKAENIHTCIETSGFGARADVEKIFSLSDLIYYDIKHANSERHQVLTGVKNELIIDHLRVAIASGNTVVVRIPFIPGVNTSLEDVADIVSLLKGISGFKQVHLLPYHNYGSGKYKTLGREYIMGDLERPDEKTLERAKHQLTHAGYECEII